MPTNLVIDISIPRPMHCPHCGSWYTCIINTVCIDINEQYTPGHARVPQDFLFTLLKPLEEAMIEKPRGFDIYA